jgi:hypothetical protein
MMSPAQIWSQVEKQDILGEAGCAPDASDADSLRNLESLECMPAKSDASAVKPGMFNLALNFFAFFAILRSSSLYRIHKYGLLAPGPEIEASPSFLASEPRKSGANSQPRSVFPGHRQRHHCMQLGSPRQTSFSQRRDDGLGDFRAFQAMKGVKTTIALPSGVDRPAFPRIRTLLCRRRTHSRSTVHSSSNVSKAQYTFG